MEKKPNIIIVMTDQQRADLRKACGYELDTMPFLDAWAKGGVDFARAYTPNPTCMPAMSWSIPRFIMSFLIAELTHTYKSVQLFISI